MKKIALGLALLTTLTFGADFTNTIGMKFKDIPSGSFTMGTQNKAEGGVKENEMPAHLVNVKSFYMSQTEVTQGEWQKVMGENPSNFITGNPNMPVEQVAFADVKNFISKLNAKEGTDKYRLPTEEEWEYAAKAGKTTEWSCGDNEKCVASVAVYDTHEPKPVKSKKPNDFGLYDMHGNLWEWVDSCWTDDYSSTKDCEYQINRGGSYYDDAYSTRSAYRNANRLNTPIPTIGFRLLKSK